jgi:DNA-binding GntR family transcriptional regulator
MAEPPAPPRAGTSVAAIHQALRDAILQGEIAAGERTTQVHLAQQLGVGRNPMREALRVLQREGLVEAEPNQRVRIAGLSVDDAEDLYVMRIALEVTAIRATVPRLDRAELAELEGLMAQMEHFQRHEDRRGLRLPHRAFHMALVSRVGSRMRDSIGELFDHAERYRLVFGGPTTSDWELRRAEHRALLDAASGEDADAAAVQLALHYTRTAVRIFAAMDPTHDPVNLRVALASVAPGALSALDAAPAPGR